LYYKLTSENPGYKNQHLGKAGSDKYRDWKARIERREAIAQLEQQLSMLKALIDRQTLYLSVHKQEGESIDRSTINLLPSVALLLGEKAMSIESVTGRSTVPAIAPNWEHPTPPTGLIFDDGEPLKSPRHRVAMNVLIRSVQQALRDRSDFYAGGNMFVYYSRTQAMNRDFGDLISLSFSMLMARVNGRGG
jgi:hypothetical protein